AATRPAIHQWRPARDAEGRADQRDRGAKVLARSGSDWSAGELRAGWILEGHGVRGGRRGRRAFRDARLAAEAGCVSLVLPVAARADDDVPANGGRARPAPAA